MINDTLHINAPDTKGPIELYLQYRMLGTGASPESRFLVNEKMDPLTDENGNQLMK